MTIEPTKNPTTAELRHNLKTPLTAMALKIQMAQKFIKMSGKSDAKLEKAIELLSDTHKEIQRFSDLIDETFSGS